MTSEPDHTANLAYELLHEVFSYLPLRDKLRVESVSRRFQRCVLELMKMQPQPLKLKLNSDTGRMNGYSVSSGKLDDAVLALAKKSKFNKIDIGFGWDFNNKQFMDTLLLILLDAQCLDKVVSFSLDRKYAARPAALGKFFAQCAKITSIRLRFLAYRPPDGLDLSFLGNLGLTQLELQLEKLVELFHSLKPQTLQKLSLTLIDPRQLDFVEMARELSMNAWAHLQELSICWEDTFLWLTPSVNLSNLFQSLALFPVLNKCDVDLVDEAVHPNDQFVPVMTSLFKCSVKTTLTSSREGFLRHRLDDTPDCQVVAKIRQLQNLHPSMGVEFFINHFSRFEDDPIFLSLSKGNGLFEEQARTIGCGDPHCFECHRFYPRVLTNLVKAAYERSDVQLDGYQLNRCTVDTVVEHLNWNYERRHFKWLNWRAINANANDAGDLVTILFEALEEDEQTLLHQYSVTVECGQCFSSSCIRCVNVE